MNEKKPKEMYTMPDLSCLNDLLGDGVVFESSDGCGSIDLNDIVNSSSDDENVLENQGFDDPVTGSKYVKESFDELKSKMEPIDETNKIFKSIIHNSDGEVINEDSVTTILMSNYLEGKSTPLTVCSKFEPMRFNLSERTLLPGILKAIFTMKVGEKSKFLIDYSLMYGELGCPPVIPKKATCLVHICVLKSTKVENQYVTQNDLCEETASESTFVLVEKKAKILCDEAKYHIKNDQYNNASRLLSNALHMFKQCSLANQEEENKQKRIVCEIYLELADCYNKMNMPKKACVICNEFRRIFGINKSWKMLYFNAIANKMLGNVNMAKKDLKQALKVNLIDKKDKKIIENELKSIEKREDACETYREGLKVFLEEQSKEKDIKCSIEPQQIAVDFLKEVENICEFINNDPSLQRYKLDLPPGLSDSEVHSIDLTATAYGMSVVYCKEIENKKSLIFIKK